MLMTAMFRDRSHLNWDRPLFSLGGHCYSRSDVVVAAILRGDWARLEDRTRNGLACMKRARGGPPPSIDVQKAIEEFRYARNLITVEETDDWLARAGLTFDGWTAYLERALLLRMWAGDLEPIATRFPVSDDELGLCIRTEAVCSGELARFAEILAGRVCVRERAAASCRDAQELHDVDTTLQERVAGAFARLSRSDGIGITPQDCAARIARVACLEAIFHAHARIAVTPMAIEAQVEAHRIRWIRVRWRYIVLPEQHMANEAALCIRQDGESLEGVARRARAAVCVDDRLLESLDSPTRDAVLSAKPDELVGPIDFGDSFGLGVVESKVSPSVDDPDVARRAAEAIVAALVTEQMKHVRWHERL